MKTSWRHWFGACFIVALSGAPHAHAAMVTFGGTFNPTGNVYNAKVSATFSNPGNSVSYQNGETFTLTLNYTSASVGGSGFDNGGVLTGFIWTMPESVNLGIGDIGGTDITSGVVTGPSSTLVGNFPAPAGTQVGNYWSFREDVIPTTSPPTTVPLLTGVGAAGGEYKNLPGDSLITFGATDVIQLPTKSPDGVDYGLLPYGNGTSEINGSQDKTWIQSQSATVDTSVIFTFKVTQGSLVLSQITAPKFLFGSGLEYFSWFPAPEDSTVPVPEPGSIAAMLSLASFGVGSFIVRRRRANKLAA